jgi:UDP-glucose 4-epimerase
MGNSKNILIIGADSFVARNFVQKSQLQSHFQLVSRKQLSGLNVIRSKDYSDIDEKLFEWADVVLNCVAVVHSPKAPVESYYRINHRLTSNNAAKARKNGVRLFIQLSTIAVYGMQSYIDQTTEEKPVSHYAKSKLLADKRLQNMQTGLFKILIIRPPMIYGAFDTPGNLKRLIHLVDKGWPLPLARNKNKRQFLNVHNLAAILDELIEKEKTGVIIPADREHISTRELVDIIGNKLNKKARLFHVPGQDVIIKFLFPALYHKLFADSIIDPDFCYTLSQGTGISKGIEEMIGT